MKTIVVSFCTKDLSTDQIVAKTMNSGQTDFTKAYEFAIAHGGIWNKNMIYTSKEAVSELCPCCGEEVLLIAEKEAQICPNCGKTIIPCALCDMDQVDCSECKLNKEYGTKNLL